MKKMIAACALPALGAAAAAAAAPRAGEGTPPTQYTFVEIGLLPGANTTVPWAINNDAHVVGWGQGPGFVRPFLWTPQAGIMEFPALPPGFTYGFSTDISHTGIIVGIAYNGPGTGNQGHAWRWMNGSLELLPEFPGDCPGMLPLAVNDAGDVVGQTCPEGSLRTPAEAWFFADDTGLMPLKPVGLGSANDISNARVVTGGAAKAYRWPAPTGRVRKLPLLPPPHDDASVGVAINESNQVTGYGIQLLSGPDAHRAFWHDDVEGLIPLVTDGPSRSAGYGINEKGYVVGNSGTMTTPDMVAWLWTLEGGRVELIDLVDDPHVFGVRQGTDINDHDQIVATLTTDDPLNSSPDVVLTPAGR